MFGSRGLLGGFDKSYAANISRGLNAKYRGWLPPLIGSISPLLIKGTVIPRTLSLGNNLSGCYVTSIEKKRL